MSEKSTISRSGQSECKALLDACTPLVYVHNAFRISGLAVDASAKDIKRRIDDLKHAEELGDAESEHTHAFALEPPPTIERIREAAHCLQDPERRVIEEFFWFWPNQWGGGRTDDGLSALANGNKDAAFRAWSSALSSGNGPASVVAKHNLAVMYQLVALDSEHYALEEDLSSDQLQTIVKYWRTSFKWWEELTTDEIFWSLVTDRIRMLDDDRLTTGLSRRMRITLPQALDKINAMLAVAFFEKGKLELGKQHVTYMLETHQGMDDVPKTLAIVTKPLKDRVESSIEKARAVALREPKNAAQSARDLLNAVDEPLKIIQMILPATDHERIDLCDSVADSCLGCSVAYSNETKDWKSALAILDNANRLAVSKETQEAIAKNRSIVYENMIFVEHIKPIYDELGRLDRLDGLASMLHQVRTVIVPMLQKVMKNKSISSNQQASCADSVAGYLREVAVAAYNQGNNKALAIAAHQLAMSLARDPALIKRLQEDDELLKRISEREKLAAELKSVFEKSSINDYVLSLLESAIEQKMPVFLNAGQFDLFYREAAIALREYALRACNGNGKHRLGRKAIRRALEYANRMPNPDISLVQALNKDLSVLDENCRMAIYRPLTDQAVDGVFNQISNVASWLARKAKG